MTDRNNEARLAGIGESASSFSEENKPIPLTFPSQTELVDIPSEGRFYPEGHPLHNVKQVEIKYMTAKEEDILTSQSLIKNKVVLDRLLESVIVSPRVMPQYILPGDKSALLIAARITGYGDTYETKVTCSNCKTKVEHTFSLTNKKEIKGGDTNNSKMIDVGIWNVQLPITKWNVHVRLLTVKDENELLDIVEERRKKGKTEHTITEQFKKIIVSIDGHTDEAIIKQAIDNMPAKDAIFLRKEYGEIVPTVEIKDTFTCSNCGFSADMEVPLDVDFFWTKS